ncbi:MAG TPA: archease [Candidatus Binatia bacterium]
MRGKAWGETMDPNKHELAIEVKGATCTEVAVKQDTNGNWIAQCVVDV